MSEPIVATVVEAPRPTLFIGMKRASSMAFSTVLAMTDEENFKKHLVDFPEYGHLRFIVPGSADSERLTEAKVREAAEKWEAGLQYGEGSKTWAEEFIAFAKSLGVVEEAK